MTPNGVMGYKTEKLSKFLVYSKKWAIVSLSKVKKSFRRHLTSEKDAVFLDSFPLSNYNCENADTRITNKIFRIICTENKMIADRNI